LVETAVALWPAQCHTMSVIGNYTNVTDDGGECTNVSPRPVALRSAPGDGGEVIRKQGQSSSGMTMPSAKVAAGASIVPP
jgi:hypothetical protein